MQELSKSQKARTAIRTFKTLADGIADLYEATGPDGTFVYTFFKAVADNAKM